MGEHLPCKQGVRSSILLISTILNTNRKVEIKTGFSLSFLFAEIILYFFCIYA